MGKKRELPEYGDARVRGCPSTGVPEYGGARVRVMPEYGDARVRGLVGPEAHQDEFSTFNRGVVGSTPTRPTRQLVSGL